MEFARWSGVGSMGMSRKRADFAALETLDLPFAVDFFEHGFATCFFVENSGVVQCFRGACFDASVAVVACGREFFICAQFCIGEDGA